MDFKKPNQLGVGKSFVVENPFLKKSAGKVNQSLDLTSGRLPQENLQGLMDEFDIQSQSQKLDELEQMAMDVLEDI
jgi:hypothetical protein